MMSQPPQRGLEEALKDIGMGASILLDTQGQPCVLFKLPEDVDFDASTPIGYGRMEFFEYDPEGAIIRFLFEVYLDLDHLERPLLVLDCFLDPTDESGKELLERLATCTGVLVHAWWNDADMTYLGCKMIRWQEQHRRSILRLQQASSGKQSQWPEVKIRCMRENPLL
jgi:hypothetical protein